MPSRLVVVLGLIAALLGAVVGVGGAGAAPAGRRCRPTEGPPPPRQVLELDWTVRERTSGCFFFSGPADLGRDAQLGPRANLALTATEATLDFGRGVTFQGARSGDAIRLRRRWTAEYQGAWDIDETIEGTIRGNTLTAAYRYHECARGQSCGGGCTIGADVKACGFTP